MDLEASPSGKEPWKASVRWTQITKVCFRASDLYSPDVIRIYIEEGKYFDIPMDAVGGFDLWDALIEKGLFDEDTASDLRFAENETRCWPP